MSYPSSAYTHSWAYNNPSVVIEHGDGTLTMYKTFNSNVKFYNLGTKLGMDTTTSYYMFTFNGTSWSSHTTKTATGSVAPYTTEINIADIDFNSVRIFASGENEEILPNPFAPKPIGFYDLPSGISNYYMIAEDGSWTVYYTDKVFYVTSGVSGIIYLTESSPHTFIKFRKWNLGATSWGSETQANTVTYTNNTDTRRIAYNSSDRLIRYTSTVGLAEIPFEEPSEEVENYNGVAEISQASTVVSVNSKQSKLVASVSQPSTVVTAYTKAESSEDYDLVAEVNQSSSVVANLSKQVSSIASVEQVSTIEAQNTKAINLASEVSQPSTVVAQANKLTYLVADISRLSSVSAENKKSTYLVAEINQGSTVYSTVSAEVPTYEFDLVASVNQSSSVFTSLNKQSSLLGQVAQDESVESQASKHIEVVASIEQGSTVYSFVTKEELEKTISASVGQQSSVVASVSKQSDITALIEQISVVLARISRGSTSRIIRPIRLTSSFKGGVRHGMTMPEPLGKALQLKGAVKSQTRFNQPIRKELKF